MIEEQRLRHDLQKLLNGTENAIRERLADEPMLEVKLRARHNAAVQAARTEGSAKGYEAFAEDAITQAAAHWLLAAYLCDSSKTMVGWTSGTPRSL